MSSSQAGGRSRMRIGGDEKKRRRVAVVYYLWRSRQGGLEHPHLMEVEVSSEQQELRLRDVTRRLDALRGKGMAAMYSWSCKRSYRGGYVWHDLAHPDDLLLPTHAGDYVLKASLLVHHPSTTTAPVASSTANTLLVADQCTSCRTPPRSSSSSSSVSSLQGSSSSPKSNTNNNSSSKEEEEEAVVVLVEPPKLVAAAATQTDDDDYSTATATATVSVAAAGQKQGTASARVGGSRSLESLIMADDSSFRGMLEDDEEDETGAGEEMSMSSIYRVKPANLLMRLIACGCGCSTSIPLPVPAAATCRNKKQLQLQLDGPGPATADGFGYVQQLESLPLSPVLSPLPDLVNSKHKHPPPAAAIPHEQHHFSGGTSITAAAAAAHEVAARGKLSSVADDLVQRTECSNGTGDLVNNLAAANIKAELAHSRPVVVAFRLDKHDDNVIKIEERLASGARVTISSTN
ncbi:uncharacterized protein LOC102720269 [Oryza brachyantha]|uniref:uncharacterized protein LOC102720269 n=1 Tax=Oryza brachyantha TaxID=4533 RepID=UPI001ADAFB4F|nr:uncharacterized protein LOC102720269 [Oryza brachyantha]